MCVNFIFVLVFSKSLKNLEEMKIGEKSFKKQHKLRFLNIPDIDESGSYSESDDDSGSISEL